MYSFDTTEEAVMDRRSREWTAFGLSEADCVIELGRCLKEFGSGRVPK
jgi:hypothetical protein